MYHRSGAVKEYILGFIPYVVLGIFLGSFVLRARLVHSKVGVLGRDSQGESESLSDKESNMVGARGISAPILG